MTETITYEITADAGQLQIVDHPDARTIRFEHDHPDFPLMMMLSTAGSDDITEEPTGFTTFDQAKITITIEAPIAVPVSEGIGC